MSAEEYLTVSQLNNYISRMFELDEVLSGVAVEGEISNFKSHASGHYYFSVKDAFSRINCVMFKSAVQRLKFVPCDGMNIVAYGYVGVYEKAGSYQLYVSALKKQGVGSLYEKYRKLLSEYEKQGYFRQEIKKNIPFLPKSIALVTSPTGAAVKDMISVITRRCPITKIIVCPVLVQGESAADEIANMIDYINKHNVADLIIAGRGGGSIEELWAFNEPQVAESVFKSKIPIISAVGHEVDFTICDFVADIRAATPSAAAEVAVPDIKDLKFTLDKYISSLKDSLGAEIKHEKQKLDYLCMSHKFKNPMLIVDERRINMDVLVENAEKLAAAKINESKKRLEYNINLLESLNYENILKRGFCIISKDGNFLTENDVSLEETYDILTKKKIFNVNIKNISERQKNENFRR